MNLFLSRARVDYELAAKRGLRDTYDWHQKVWEAFPQREDQKRDFLTRVDRKDTHFQLLIVSPIAPHRPGWCPTDAWESKQISPDFFEHPRYWFSLLANPTEKKRKLNAQGEPTKNGRRVPLTRREDLVAWLERKAAASGFRVDLGSLRILARGREYFHKRDLATKKDTVGLHAAREFCGVMDVTDRGAFIDAFRRGIGSAKAFGFGLLVLAPVYSPNQH